MAVEATTNLKTRAEAVMAQCDHLAQFSIEADKLTRPYGSDALRDACDAVAEWMRSAGMTTRRDAIGSVIGRYEPDGTKDQPPLLLGGHIDTVRDAGKYDGMLGVLLGIAVVAQVRDNGVALPFPVEVVAFADEDGLRFHTAYLASWAFAGTFDPTLLTRTDADGITIAEAIRAFGGDPDTVVNGGGEQTVYRGYLEAHIEQGPALEAAGLPVGVVAAIAGQTRFAVTFTGMAGHAGTVPMALRQDALCAAAEFVLAVEAIGRATPGLVATVGRVSVEPGASNVVPGRVMLTVDVRHTDDLVRVATIDTVLARLDAVAQSRQIEIAVSNRNDAPAVACDPTFVAGLAASVGAIGLPVQTLVSGAGHDAVALAARMPVGMLFVRCAGGISHNPAESVSVDDVATAIAVVDHWLAQISTVTT